MSNFTLAGTEMHKVSFCGVSHNLICDGATLQGSGAAPRRRDAALPRYTTAPYSATYALLDMLSYLDTLCHSNLRYNILAKIFNMIVVDFKNKCKMRSFMSCHIIKKKQKCYYYITYLVLVINIITNTIV